MRKQACFSFLTSGFQNEEEVSSSPRKGTSSSPSSYHWITQTCLFISVCISGVPLHKSVYVWLLRVCTMCTQRTNWKWKGPSCMNVNVPCAQPCVCVLKGSENDELPWIEKEQRCETNKNWTVHSDGISLHVFVVGKFIWVSDKKSLWSSATKDPFYSTLVSATMSSSSEVWLFSSQSNPRTYDCSYNLNLIVPILWANIW